MATLVLDKVTKRFGSTVAVASLSLQVASGEFLTLLGPSGCGKTTTLRMIAGFIRPDEGEILFDGQPVSHIPPDKRHTAMVFQSYALFPHMTVSQNVSFGLRMRHTPRQETDRRVQEALSLVGLEQLAARYPRELSGGQQQRVAVARALVMQPKVLLFDEPLSNLDAKLRERMRFEIKALQKRLGITSIYVTHDQAEALVISDRVAVMNGGRLEQLGTPLQIYNDPANPFVAGFIGLTNFVSGQVVGRRDDGVYQVATTAGVWLCRCHGDVPLGRRVTVSIRPEAISLLSADQVVQADNQCTGRIVQRTYLGSLSDYIVEVSPDLALRVQVQGQRIMEVNTPVRVAASAENCLIHVSEE